MKKRTLSCLLVLVLLVSCLFGTVSAAELAAADLPYNTGTRHEIDKSLSDQATQYYSGKYDPDTLLALPGSDSKSSLKSMDSELFKALHELMSGTLTDTVTYQELTAYWAHTDASKGEAGTILFYSDIVEEAFNREHVWPKSHGSFFQINAGADLHHLRPTNSSVNSTRSNYTMGNVVDIYPDVKEYSHNNGTPIWYSPEASMVEIGDNIKGDVARIYLYVYCCWEQPNLFEDVAAKDLPAFDSDDHENDGIRPIADLDTLLYWMEIDPVDTWEMSRNDLVEQVQGNRNVFIDYPELAWLLFDEPLPADYETPSGFAKTHGVETPSVTAVSADETQGTVDLINNVIALHPAEGYAFDKFTVEPAGAAEVTQEGNLLRVSAVKEDCTVTVYFAPKAEATISFSTPAGVEAEGGTLHSFVGDTVTLPTATGSVENATQEYAFLGWTEMPTDDTDTLPKGLHYPGESYYVTGDVTLYALFYYKVADEGSTDQEYVAVTQEPEDWSGSYCIVAPASGMIMTNTLNGNAAGSNVYLTNEAIDVYLGSVKNPNPNYLYTLKPVESAPGCYYVTDVNGNYLACSRSKVMQQVAPADADLTDTAFFWQPSLSGLMTYEGRFGLLCYNNGSPRFTTYSGTSGVIENALLFEQTTATKIHYTGAQAHIHVLGEVTEVPPTCTKDGSRSAVCQICGETVTEVLPATGHNYEVKETSAATCTADGYILRVCKNCGDETREVLQRFACPSEAYSDVLHAWYHDDVDAVLNAKLMNGTDTGVFEPNGTLKRAMVVTVLYRYDGEHKADSRSKFTDVEQGRWYTDAIDWAAANGVVNGMTETTFEPDSPVTREQLAAMLYRYACYRYFDTTAAAALSGYADAQTVSNFAQTAVAWAVGEQIIRGYVEDGANLLHPKGLATRAEFATMVNRFTNGAEECTHDFETVTKDATCTAEGSVTYTCKLCGKVNVEVLPALGHEFGEWKLTKEPTADAEGEEERACTRCDAKETRPVEKLNYRFTLTDTLKDGDQVVIFCPSEKMLMTDISEDAEYTHRLHGLAHEGDTLNMLPEHVALLTVSVNAEGQYLFKYGEQYLVCSSGSGSLFFSDTPTFGTWYLDPADGGVFLRSVDSVKMLNGTPVPVYAEYYGGNFTSYYFTGDSTNYAPFTFRFFRYDPIA